MSRRRFPRAAFDGSAADEHHELAPLHSNTSSARASSAGGTDEPLGRTAATSGGELANSPDGTAEELQGSAQDNVPQLDPIQRHRRRAGLHETIKVPPIPAMAQEMTNTSHLCSPTLMPIEAARSSLSWIALLRLSERRPHKLVETETDHGRCQHHEQVEFGSDMDRHAEHFGSEYTRQGRPCPTSSLRSWSPSSSFSRSRSRSALSSRSSHCASRRFSSRSPSPVSSSRRHEGNDICLMVS